MDDRIVKSITRLVIPFIQLYGIFIILHGHITPGGGFSGGTLIGTSLILYTLVFGLLPSKKKFSHRMSQIAESGGIVIYVGIGLIGLFLSGQFLTNLDAGFPIGEPGELFSAGMIPLLMITIGIKVASTMVSLFHLLIEGDLDADHPGIR
ncbi:MAG: MnhB domain-containing protein [Acholeplasmataceae bacterium]|jgi:multicomponent Na+:H+ antiporter subunit B|nr:MnhB domain-containing protein [Acholeplasmataceae bacterium]